MESNLFYFEGDNESKVILDAFFLGKAFAEALNERIESTVGEFLSVIGQWQAEQQKQVLDFQVRLIFTVYRLTVFFLVLCNYTLFRLILDLSLLSLLRDANTTTFV
jgi:hypothetical protein